MSRIETVLYLRINRRLKPRGQRVRASGTMGFCIQGVNGEVIAGNVDLFQLAVELGCLDAEREVLTDAIQLAQVAAPLKSKKKSSTPEVLRFRTPLKLLVRPSERNLAFTKLSGRLGNLPTVKRKS